MLQHFLSVAEKWFWRMSACYIEFCLGGIELRELDALAERILGKWMDGEKKWWQNVIPVTLIFICGLSLMVARAYIVMEPFLSIHKLPVEAYETPSWTQIFPHL